MYFVEAADEADAEKRFTDETGEDIHDVCFDCCGPNFSLSGGGDTLEEVTEYWRGGQTLDDYLNEKRNLVKVMPLTSEDILL